MRKVFHSNNEIFRIYKSEFSPNPKQPADTDKKFKIAAEPEKKDSDFSRMLNAEILALS